MSIHIIERKRHIISFDHINNEIEKNEKLKDHFLLYLQGKWWNNKTENMQ